MHSLRHTRIGLLLNSTCQNASTQHSHVYKGRRWECVRGCACVSNWDSFPSCSLDGPLATTRCERVLIFLIRRAFSKLELFYVCLCCEFWVTSLVCVSVIVLDFFGMYRGLFRLRGNSELLSIFFNFLLWQVQRFDAFLHYRARST